MLEVYRGIAVRSYENDFFREFSLNLSAMFEKYNWNGVLIGNSTCTTNSTLQIDALLICKHVACIIDFKNYSGNIELPSTYNFNSGIWQTDDGGQVKGGSSINPYQQLTLQRKKFYDCCKNNIIPQFKGNSLFNPSHTIRIVCFQNKIEIRGSIPSKDEINFKIIHSENYLEKLKDIIDIESREVIIQKEDYSVFLDIFQADKFDFREEYLATTEIPQTEKQATELRETQKQALKSFDNFLKSEEQKVFILKGSTQSGKSYLIDFFRDRAFELKKFHHIEILSPSGRIARNLMSELSGTESLYSFLYDIGKKSNIEVTIENDEEKTLFTQQIPLKKISSEEDKTLFILDQAEFVSSNFSIGLDETIFGSGRLLDDLINYLELNKENGRRLVLIGDPYLNTIGKIEENALCSEWLRQRFEIEVCEFLLADNPRPSDLLKNALSCVQGIRNSVFTNLDFDFSEIFKQIPSEELKTQAKEWKDPNDKDLKYLCFTNNEAKNKNLWYKDEILKNGEDLNKGDLLLLCNNIKVGNKKSIKSCYNGSFYTVLSCEDVKERQVQLKGYIINLYFRRIKALSDTGEVLSFLSLENFMYAEKSELEKEETIALKILKNKVLKKALAESRVSEKLKEIEEYKAIEQDLKDLRKRFDNGEKVKTKIENAERELRKLERKTKTAFKKKLEADPNSPLFILNNLAYFRYGWALTVDRALSYKWKRVILNTNKAGQEQTNEGYFRWLYSGLTRATEEIALINYEAQPRFYTIDIKEDINKIESKNNILPFFIADINQELPQDIASLIEPKAFTDTKSLSIVIQLYNFVARKLEQIKLRIVSIQHLSYQERYQIEDESKQTATLDFSYKLKGEIKKPKISKCQDTLSVMIMEALTNDDFSISNRTISDVWREKAYNKLASILETKNTKITDIEQGKNFDFLYLKQGNESLKVQIYYKDKGYFSKLNGQSTTSEAIWKEFKEIINRLKTEQQ